MKTNNSKLIKKATKLFIEGIITNIELNKIINRINRIEENQMSLLKPFGMSPISPVSDKPFYQPFYPSVSPESKNDLRKKEYPPISPESKSDLMKDMKPKDIAEDKDNKETTFSENNNISKKMNDMYNDCKSGKITEKEFENEFKKYLIDKKAIILSYNINKEGDNNGK